MGYFLDAIYMIIIDFCSIDPVINAVLFYEASKFFA